MVIFIKLLCRSVTRVVSVSQSCASNNCSFAWLVINAGVVFVHVEMSVHGFLVS